MRNLVSAITATDTRFNGDTPLIWLDTLCCPAKDGAGKQKAIEKIRLVYKQAAHVLVLDSGLMAYEVEHQDISEQLFRIFTSSWMRRLWTLQEGALAPSLFFQFADQAISLGNLGMALLRTQKISMRHRAMRADVVREINGLGSFFTPDNPPTLTLLDDSLKFRSVSVASDEPLCIGTLLSLDLNEILAVKVKDDRMQKIWELLSGKLGGIPSQIIFFEEARINSPGWKWAPKSLLQMRKGIHDLSSRMIRWADPQLGTITPRGLLVRYPAYRIKALRDYGDGKPRNPWPGFARIPESYIYFRDAETGNWFRISDKGYAFLNTKWTTEEERLAYNKLGLFPLHEMVETDTSVVIVRAVGDILEGIFASVVEDSATPGEGIPVRTARFIMVQPLKAEDGYIYDTVRRLAMDLRRDVLTDEHLRLYDRLVGESKSDGEELKGILGEHVEYVPSQFDLNV